MCGIAGVFGPGPKEGTLETMVAAQHHRGPDSSAVWLDRSGGAGAGLGHNRLSIIDPSPAAAQPMASCDGRYWIVFNGEIYNYVELRGELAGYGFRTASDTETILAAYQRWGDECLDRLIGMFAFLLWDTREQRLLAARDRFGVKPLYYVIGDDGRMLFASETRALRVATGLSQPDEVAWATYLSHGWSDYSDRTFWKDVRQLPPGHRLIWQGGRFRIERWYDLAERVGSSVDTRAPATVGDEYLALLQDSIRLRFRSDVPVGINLSGGLDSSTLLGLVQMVQGAGSSVTAYTFTTGDARYDELPWVRQMLAATHHPSAECLLVVQDVPDMARRVFFHQDAPFGGLPTLAYGRLFERARQDGVIVLLDGQGMDEQWAGYDYYLDVAHSTALPIVQGARDPAMRPACLTPALRALAEICETGAPFPDALRNAQYRDICFTKLPRALRFNDRVSMQYSTELREPFLDHRLVELAFRQPAERKIRGGVTKWFLRQVVRDQLPGSVWEAPKRAVQTPQREWFRGPLRAWVEDQVDAALAGHAGSWLDARAVRAELRRYMAGEGDNSFYVWQWVCLGMLGSARSAGTPEWVSGSVGGVAGVVAP